MYTPPTTKGATMTNPAIIKEIATIQAMADTVATAAETGNHYLAARAAGNLVAAYHRLDRLQAQAA